MKRSLYTLVLIFFSVATFGQAKYVFLFIGDGMGVNQVNGTEMYCAELQKHIGTVPLLFTQFPFATNATTFSATNSVTDSAASGTALATGEKTYNGAISVDQEKKAIETIAEKAKKDGHKVGIATTVSIDHATPAVFYAHQPQRNMYYEIANDLPKSNFDFFGGSGFLKPHTTCKGKEAPSIFPMLKEKGYTLAYGYDDYKTKAGKANKMILMQKKGSEADCLPYAIDRKDDDLTLAQITESAIDFLTKDKDKGFFVMLEGGKIDWACHGNDAATTFKEIIDMDNAIKVAYEFYKKHPKNTLILITADHETGGMALGTGKYELNLQALQYQKHSIETLSKEITQLRESMGSSMTWEEMKTFLSEEMGFWNKLPISWDQEKAIRDAFEKSFKNNNVDFEKNLYAQEEPVAACARKVMNEIAMISWASDSHSAGLVPVFAIGAGAEKFAKKTDNAQIDKTITKIARYK